MRQVSDETVRQLSIDCGQALLKVGASAADEARVPAWLFEPGMFVGVGALAFWMRQRFPTLEPRSIRRAAAHLGVSVLLFNLVPIVVRASMGALPRPLAVAVAIAVVTVPSFCYLLLSVIWLFTRMHDEIGSSPRGGHPAALE
jgi:hypothetical protein